MATEILEKLGEKNVEELKIIYALLSILSKMGNQAVLEKMLEKNLEELKAIYAILRLENSEKTTENPPKTEIVEKSAQTDSGISPEKIPAPKLKTQSKQKKLSKQKEKVDVWVESQEVSSVSEILQKLAERFEKPMGTATVYKYLHTKHEDFLAENKQKTERMQEVMVKKSSSSAKSPKKATSEETTQLTQKMRDDIKFWVLDVKMNESQVLKRFRIAYWDSKVPDEDVLERIKIVRSQG